MQRGHAVLVRGMDIGAGSQQFDKSLPLIRGVRPSLTTNVGEFVFHQVGRSLEKRRLDAKPNISGVLLDCVFDCISRFGQVVGDHDGMQLNARLKRLHPWLGDRRNLGGDFKIKK
jgi:hypothetical protein